MESITVREFRQNLSHYLGRLKCGESIIIDGWEYAKVAQIGKARGNKRGRRAKVSWKKDYTKVREEVKEEEIEEVKEEWPRDEMGEEVAACEICGVVGEWVMWEDGEERVVCEGCIRRKSGSDRIYKMVIRGCRKI